MPQKSPPLLPIRLLSLSKHHVRSLLPDSSFAGEYSHLRKLLCEYGLANGFIVDIAASDGVGQSSTLGFFKDPSWHGLAVEMDPIKFSKLAFVYARFPNARLARARVTPENITSLLSGFEVPMDFTVLNLDIDSYDLFVIDAMLVNGFRPKIISMEINEKIPPPVYFTVKYDPSHYWEMDHFFGCSLAAACDAVRPFGYVLESLQYNNAFLVHESIANGLVDMGVQAAYASGYVNRNDRHRLFPWNSDMESVLTLPTDEVIDFLNNKFQKYDGKYILKA